MDLRKHLDEILRPCLADLAAKPDDLRHAFCSAAAIDALAAHIYWWCRQNAGHHIAGLVDDDAYRRQLRDGNRDFELASDVAKANKHVVLVKGQPSVQTASAATKVMAPG